MNSNLSYMLSRVSAVSTQTFKLEPQNSNTAQAGQQIRVAIPSNTLLNRIVRWGTASYATQPAYRLRLTNHTTFCGPQTPTQQENTPPHHGPRWLSFTAHPHPLTPSLVPPPRRALAWGGHRRACPWERS